MRENRTYGSVRGGGSNADRLLDVRPERQLASEGAVPYGIASFLLHANR